MLCLSARPAARSSARAQHAAVSHCQWPLAGCARAPAGSTLPRPLCPPPPRLAARGVGQVYLWSPTGPDLITRRCKLQRARIPSCQRTVVRRWKVLREGGGNWCSKGTLNCPPPSVTPAKGQHLCRRPRAAPRRAAALALQLRPRAKRCRATIDRRAPLPSYCWWRRAQPAWLRSTGAGHRWWTARSHVVCSAPPCPCSSTAPTGKSTPRRHGE